MKVLLLIASVFFVQAISAQQVLKEALPGSTPTNSTALRDEVNALIKKYKASDTYANFTILVEFFKRKDVLADTAFMKKSADLRKLIDSAGNNKGVVIQPLSEDGTSPAVAKTTGTTTACSKLKEVVYILVRKNADSEFEVSFTDRTENPVAGFVVKQLNETFFYDKVKQSLLNLCDGGDPEKEDTDHVDALIANFKKKGLYQHMLEAGLEVNDDAVYAGKMTIRKTIKALREFEGRSDTAGKKINGVKDTVVFTVHHVQIQFQDGFVENIKIRGKIAGDNTLLKFENAYPIPFSTRRDFRRMFKANLYERTVFSGSSENSQKVKSIYFTLGNLLDFDQNLDIDSKDYAPVNQIQTMDIKDEETVVNLEKERTSKILELKVFTDLKGIEADNPNGLVQLELSKKLNFWNIRRRGLWNLYNYGFFNYLTPSFAMTKIENNNKRLPVQYIGSAEPDTARPNSFASTLQLLQYQAFRIGADLSFLTLDVPGIKSVITVKAGLYFGRTLTVDTIRNKVDSTIFKPIADNNIRESGVNSLQFIPEIGLQIFPDKRYGVQFAYRLTNFNLLSDGLKQVSDTLQYVNHVKSLKGDRSGINNFDKGKWLGMAEVYAFYRPSTYNQVFFRYRLNYDLGHSKTNFHQIQIGFSTYLTHTSKSKKEAAAGNVD